MSQTDYSKYIDQQMMLFIEYNCEIEWDFLEYFVKQSRIPSIAKIPTKPVWAAIKLFWKVMEKKEE
jgi:hypothetical protein